MPFQGMSYSFTILNNKVEKIYRIPYEAFDSNFRYVRPANNPQLITENVVAINNVAFQIQYLALSNFGNSQRSKQVQLKAEALIELLKKEYHVE